MILTPTPVGVFYFCTMERFDYGIVGFGLAGFAITRYLELAGKNVLVLSDQSQKSSLVAGGVWNPVILKRFTPVWRGAEFLDHALSFYQDFQDAYSGKYLEYFDTYRILSDVGEQNNFIAASARVGLEQYLDPKLKENSNKGINAPFGLGRVKGTGKLNVPLLLNAYKSDLEARGRFLTESFNYENFDPNSPKLGTYTVDKVIFAEGFGMHKNPFFSYLPLKHSKGEVLTIHAPNLKMNHLLKAGVFVLPLGEDLYKIGATYNWTDTTNLPTEDGKKQLIEKLTPMLSVDYTIVDHKGGVRPTVIDRRPLVGEHPKYSNLFVLNGMGTRGVMNAPFAASQLSQYVLHGTSIDAEININRFDPDRQ